ncbi:Protein of unknown function [Cotesia congregata]|uniref:Uncharacterized protein n=1 Tax=Cotesia congregata TaxID=51543 RepID=A0A8J2ED78_COTCN|nr:Protein of unknown function [Cotesia congregata]
MWIILIFSCLTSGAFAQYQSIASSCSKASSRASASTYTKPPLVTKGHCPVIATDPVDFTRHCGIWYEVQRSANSYDSVDQCQKMLWGKPVNNVSRIITKSSSTSGSFTSTTTAHVTQNDAGTGFSYRLPTMGEVPKQYYAVGFNYVDYTIVWACENRGNGHVEQAWVFSREPAQPYNINALMKDAFARYNLTIPEMVKNDLAGCCQIYSSFDFDS